MCSNCCLPRSTALPRVSVEILVEEDQVLPVRVSGVARVVAMAWPAARLIRDKQLVHSAYRECVWGDGGRGALAKDTTLLL